MSVEKRYTRSDIAHTYSFRDSLAEQEVINFVNESPYLFDSLLEAPNQIKKVFGPSKLVLEVFNDPSLEDNNHLVIWIGTNLKADEAINTLHDLDEKWTFNLSSEVLAKLSINLGWR